MHKAWQFFVDTIDAQISGDDQRFWRDLRGLIILPWIPFFVALCFVDTPSVLGDVLVGAMFGVTIPWTIFLLRRRAIKKRSWVEPTRFSDDLY
jgi:hypothetical protein